MFKKITLRAVGIAALSLSLLFAVGKISTYGFAIDYDRISDIQVTVNPIENMLGVGTIRISAGKVI